MLLSLRQAQGDQRLQLILGADKRNPLISVYQSTETGTLHVYYGLELMEVVPDRREHVHYKLLVARLYNASVKALTLQEVFEVDRKTMKKWGEALQEGDPEKLLAALAGRSRGKKITPEIEGFVRARFESLHREHPRNYSAAMREEIGRYFGVSLSGEALRPLFSRLRGALNSAAPGTAESGGGEKRETPCAWPANGSPTESRERAEESDEPPAAPSQSTPKESPVFTGLPEGGCQFCHHAGVLLFSQALLALRENFSAETAPLLQQWLAAVLLGALNIEQTKFLDLDDLELLLGSALRQPHPQRLCLAAMGQGDTADELLALNARQSQAAEQSDFYYDPHTKRYTGEANILKGWCANRRLADKALHTDFLHSAGGVPLYMEWTDNYNTLRERFAPVIGRFRARIGIPANAAITITIDRGINSMDVFEQVIADPHLHIITWETGYRPAPWPADLPSSVMKLQRPRNRAADLRSYHFEYIEHPWKRNPRMRQILVRATNPSGRTIEVSILADDPDRPADQIIRAIFWRWVQENDFKYLDKHFGINQITSYATVDYEDLAQALEDKQMKNGQYQALEKEKRALKRELGRLLVAQRVHRARQGRKKRGAKTHGSNAHKTEANRQERIEAIDLRIKELDALLESTTREVSRLETLIAQKKQRLDTGNKSVMDAIKVLARNAFYRALAPFKRAYDNYRDDHDYFRKLTRSHGLLIGRADHLEVQLISPVNLPPKIRRIVGKLLEDLNAEGLELPDGTGRKIRLILGRKEGIQLAPQNLSEASI